MLPLRPFAVSALCVVVIVGMVFLGSPNTAPRTTLDSDLDLNLEEAQGIEQLADSVTGLKKASGSGKKSSVPHSMHAAAERLRQKGILKPDSTKGQLVSAKSVMTKIDEATAPKVKPVVSKGPHGVVSAKSVAKILAEAENVEAARNEIMKKKAKAISAKRLYAKLNRQGHPQPKASAVKKTKTVVSQKKLFQEIQDAMKVEKEHIAASRKVTTHATKKVAPKSSVKKVKYDPNAAASPEKLMKAVQQAEALEKQRDAPAEKPAHKISSHQSRSKSDDPNGAVSAQQVEKMLALAASVVNKKKDATEASMVKSKTHLVPSDAHKAAPAATTAAPVVKKAAVSKSNKGEADAKQVSKVLSFAQHFLDSHSAKRKDHVEAVKQAAKHRLSSPSPSGDDSVSAKELSDMLKLAARVVDKAKPHITQKVAKKVVGRKHARSSEEANKKQMEQIEASLDKADEMIKHITPPKVHVAKMKIPRASPHHHHSDKIVDERPVPMHKTAPIKFDLPNINDVREPPVLRRMRRENNGHLKLPSFRRLRSKMPALPSFNVPTKETKIKGQVAKLKREVRSLRPSGNEKHIAEQIAAKIKNSILSHIKFDVDEEVTKDIPRKN